MLALVGFVTLRAQVNLVPNPGFEEYYLCQNPAIVNGLTHNNFRNCSYNWFNVKGSVDLYTSTNISDIDNGCLGGGERWSIPPTIFGYQYPRTDSSFIGLATWTNLLFDSNHGHNYYTREWAGVQLKDTLKKGKCYEFTMYVSRATRVGYNISCIGAYFSKDSLFTNFVNGNYISPYPLELDSVQILQNPNIPIEDTIWVPITGIFKAKGGEKFLYIGNLLKDEDYTIVPIWPIAEDTIYCQLSYYSIDDISLYEIDEPCGVGVNENKAGNFKIYPNPAQDFVSIELRQNYNQANLSIYNLTGQLISKKQLTQPNQNIPISELGNGIYIFVIQNEDGVIGRQRVVVAR